MSREGDGASRGGRNSYVDLLRGASIAAVVVGHWLLTAIAYKSGKFDGIDAIAYVSWGSWVTLGLQVVPVFFLVGGYANALSWSRRRAAGGSWTDWLRLRMRRLLGPTSTYLAVAAVAVAIGQVAGVDGGNLSQAAWALTFDLWFLAAYAVLLLLTPLLYDAHRRWGWRVPAAMGGAAVLIGAGVVEWRWHLVGWANYVLVWGTFHQLGFAWHDGAFTGRRLRAAALAVGSGAALGLLIGPGPYPVSMVGVPGARIQNPSPPSMALLAFGLTQAGIVLLAEPSLNRLLARSPTGRDVARRSAALAMPVYLWHMVPVVVVSVIAYPAGWFGQPPIGSGSWWVQRAVWIAVLSLVLAIVVALLAVAGRVRSRHAARPADASSAGAAAVRGAYAVQLLAGVVLVSAALGRLAVQGLAPDGHVDLATLAVFAAGSMLVSVRRSQPRRGTAAVSDEPGNGPAAMARREAVGGAR